MKYADLNDKNFILFAMKHYTNQQCHDVTEFNEDLCIPIHLKKLFTRYLENGDLKERLILNHIISFFNVFEAYAAVKILFFKMNPGHYRCLKTFLVYLNRCPGLIHIDGKHLDLAMVGIDEELLKKLQGSMKANAS